MANYLYNGVELPDINTVWTDKVTYPYAVILTNASSVYLYVLSCKIVAAGVDQLVSAATGICSIFSLRDGLWSAGVQDYEVPTGASFGEPEVIIWTSHNILFGNDTIIVAASKPVLPYLTFSSDTSFILRKNGSEKSWDGIIFYSSDTITWAEWDGTTGLASAEHDGEHRIYLRGTGNSIITGDSSLSYNKWEFDGQSIRCSGNIETLLDFETVINGQHPAMGDYCFSLMFFTCTSLTEPPELPAVTLSTGCYYSMFNQCLYLTYAPELPATTLADKCYYSMFYSCKSLITPPKLPATELASHCYTSMFGECIGLTVLPELPATILPDWCYAYMFKKCTGIKLSETQTDFYTKEFRIPKDGEGTAATNSLKSMFDVASYHDYIGTPDMNTTYYVYDSSSDPVPGDTPALYGLHVPSFLQGVEVGRRLKNKRQLPNPYLFDYYRYVVSLNEEYLADLIKDYTNITNYSWQLDSKVEKVLSVPVSFKPIWSNVDFLDETEEAIFIEGSEPIYIPIKKFSLQEFLEGLIEGMLKQPFSLYRKYYGKFPEIPSQNYNTFPYLTLVKIDDSESAIKIKLKDGSYKTVKAALLASEKPLVVDANNIILKEGCNIEKAYTDYYNFYIRENEKWFQFYYSTDSVVTNKYNLIWSNYDIFDKNGALFIEGVSTPPHII